MVGTNDLKISHIVHIYRNLADGLSLLQRGADYDISFVEMIFQIFPDRFFYFKSIGVIQLHSIQFHITALFLQCFADTGDQKTAFRVLFLGIQNDHDIGVTGIGILQGK